MQQKVEREQRILSHRIREVCVYYTPLNRGPPTPYLPPTLCIIGEGAPPEAVGGVSKRARRNEDGTAVSMKPMLSVQCMYV